MAYQFQTAAHATQYFPANRPVLPEWTRFAWASMDERAWWQPIISEYQRHWTEVEKMSVVYGYRQAALIQVPATEILSLTEWACDHGVIAVPKLKTAVGKRYQSESVSLGPNESYDYAVLILRPESFHKIPHTLQDNEALGESLGYPSCCRSLFQRTWGSGQIDSTYDQMMNTDVVPTANGPVETNLFWRWLGIRLVSHLPCSIQCSASIELGQQFREVIRRMRNVEDVLAADSILSWPLTWSSINGITEIVGPPIKISTRTDWSPEERLFRREGEYHLPETPLSHLWTDNAFNAADHMRSAHTAIIHAIRDHAPQRAVIYDLGCGNGLLLKRAKLHRPDVKIGGNDLKEDAILRAKKGLIGNWRAMPIQDTACLPTDTARPNVVVFSPVRLLEMSEVDATRLRHEMTKLSHVFVYAYSDCIERFTSLTALCQEAQLPIPTIISSTDRIQVGVITYAH